MPCQCQRNNKELQEETGMMHAGSNDEMYWKQINALRLRKRDIEEEFRRNNKELKDKIEMMD